MHAFAPLYAQPLLTSNERAESFRLVAEALSDYRLTWAYRAQVNTAVHAISSPQMHLYAMHYGDEVLIQPQLYADFCLVHFALKAPIEVDVDGVLVHVPQGGVLFCNPQRRVQLRWAAHCEQLILRVPTDLLQTSMHAVDGLPPYVLMDAAAAQVWITQLQSYVHYAAFVRSTHPQAPFQDWLTHVEHGMLQFLVAVLTQAMGIAGLTSAADPAGTSALLGHNTLSQRRVAERLTRLQIQVSEHLDEPWTLERLAACAAVSARQLSAWFQDAWGVSPMAWLRQLRLQAVRDALLTQPELDVTSLALRYGFAHMGRFAAYYRAAFAERPSETRRRVGLN